MTIVIKKPDMLVIYVCWFCDNDNDTFSLFSLSARKHSHTYILATLVCVQVYVQKLRRTVELSNGSQKTNVLVHKTWSHISCYI